MTFFCDAGVAKPPPTHNVRHPQHLRVQPSRRVESPLVDAADGLIERTCYDAQCEVTMTFDVNAAKGTGMRLIRWTRVGRRQ